MNKYPTPHIDALPSDFARTLLMPGDPQRSEFIAKNMLDSPRLINNVRGVQGYTGTYKGVPVSVMASGMGMPSMAIYSHELYDIFGVENIIRIGSAGGISRSVDLRDIVAAIGTCTDSAYTAGFGLPGTFAPTADFDLLSLCAKTAQTLGISDLHIGNVLTTDRFYNESTADVTTPWANMGVLAVEMETAALYANAARYNGRALGIFTVSDHLVKGGALSAEERRSSFSDMISLALEVAYAADSLPSKNKDKFQES